jgi:hypothetical protein
MDVLIGSCSTAILLGLWLARWGGADVLDGAFTSGLFGAQWNPESLRLLGWAMVVAAALCLVIGIVWAH